METGLVDGRRLMKLVFLLEERSMKYLLDGILPVILPKDVAFQTIPHEGKNDLKKSIPIKLRAWNEPDVRFIVVHDQDSNDCTQLKSELLALCATAGKETLVRIACRELEAWYWGDLDAVEKAYSIDLTKYRNKKKYRIPDNIMFPKEELRKIIPEHQQISGAKRIAQYMCVENNKSKSFQVFISGVRGLCRNI